MMFYNLKLVSFAVSARRVTLGMERRAPKLAVSRTPVGLV